MCGCFLKRLMTYLKIKQKKVFGQLGFLILPKAFPLFASIKFIKVPFIPMSLITWPCSMQNLSRQADETLTIEATWKIPANFDSRNSQTRCDSHDHFSERFSVLCQAIYTNQVALSAQIPMSSSKLLELVAIQIQKLCKCCRILLKTNCFRVLLIV